eukprot:COSAG05_NODE_1277_length_5304_cov_5.087992_6_plen_420_part_00
MPPAGEEDSSSDEDIDDSEDSDKDEAQGDVDSMAKTKKLLRKAQGSAPPAEEWVDYGYNYTKDLPAYFVAGEGLEMIEVTARPVGALGAADAAPAGSGLGAAADDGKPAPTAAALAMSGFPPAGKGKGQAEDKYGLGKLMIATELEEDDDFQFHAPGVYHDLGCSCAFLAVAVGMVAIALMGVTDSFGLEPEVVVTPTTCTQACQNGGWCSERGDFCDCPTGCFGDFCESCMVVIATPNMTNATVPEPEPEPVPPTWSSDQLAMLLATVGIALGSGVLTALVVVAAIRRYPDHVIWLPLGMFALLQFSVGIALIAVMGNWIGALFILASGLTILAFYLLRAWMMFATAILAASLDVLNEHKGLAWVALGGVAANVVWVAIWAFAMITTVRSGSGAFPPLPPFIYDTPHLRSCPPRTRRI